MMNEDIDCKHTAILGISYSLNGIILHVCARCKMLIPVEGRLNKLTTTKAEGE